MIVYFGILKDGVTIEEAQKYLKNLQLTFVRFYAALGIVQFESKEKIMQELSIFKTIEEERDDFQV